MAFSEKLKNLLDVEVFFDEPMKKHTSIGVGGNAEYFVKVKSLYALNQVITIAKAHKIPNKVIGNGTNILVADTGYPGIIIKPVFCDLFFRRNYVRAMAGAKMQDLVEFSIKNSLAGLEYFAGIPATIGGAVVMNAGAFGKTISEYVEFIETIKDGKLVRYSKDQCKFGYRTSRFKSSKDVIVAVDLKLEKTDNEILLNSAKSYLEIRKKCFPFGKSFGSVFKNPNGDYSGRLIESLHLKGKRIGGAVVSEKHANFIINDKNATALDVYSLINEIKERVQKEYSIKLQEEVIYLGKFT